MKLKNIFNKMSKKEDKDKVQEEETLVKDQTKGDQKETNETAETKDNSKEKAKEEVSEVEQLKLDLAEAKDKYLRLFAEFDNFRKRTNKEKLELRKTAAQDTLSAFIPVLDDFDRAKKNHDDDGSEEEFTEGVMFVYEKVMKFAKSRGLEPVDPTGEVFDGDFHEAITEIPAPTEDMKGKIIDTIERGYTLNDKMIRYAKVVVGK